MFPVALLDVDLEFIADWAFADRQQDDAKATGKRKETRRRLPTAVQIAESAEHSRERHLRVPLCDRLARAKSPTR
jgi:hypothetical protein